MEEGVELEPVKMAFSPVALRNAHGPTAAIISNIFGRGADGIRIIINRDHGSGGP